MHENYKASKTGKEEETKDASSIVNVKWYQLSKIDLGSISFSLTTFFTGIGSRPFMSIYIDPASYSSLKHVTSDSSYSKLTREYKGCFYIQTSLSSWRWCNLDVPGSCNLYLYILHFFFVCVDVYVVQLMQVTMKFLTLCELICESSNTTRRTLV